MCTYKDIDIIELPNGQMASEANLAASREIERIYADSWHRGVSVPFFDNDGNTYLANPDGNEELRFVVFAQAIVGHCCSIFYILLILKAVLYNLLGPHHEQGRRDAFARHVSYYKCHFIITNEE